MDAFVKRIQMKEYLIVKSNKEWIPIRLDNIVYLEAKGKETAFYIKGQKDMVECFGVMASYEDKLPDDRFFRCQKSFIVNLDYISSYTFSDITINNSITIRLGRGKYVEFWRCMKNIFSIDWCIGGEEIATVAEKAVLFLCVFFWSLVEFAIVYLLERKVFGVDKKRITKRFLVAATIYVAIIVTYIIGEVSALSALGFLLTVLFYIKSYIILNEVTIIEKTETLLDIILVPTFVGIGGQTIFYYISSSNIIRGLKLRKSIAMAFLPC